MHIPVLMDSSVLRGSHTLYFLHFKRPFVLRCATHLIIVAIRRIRKRRDLLAYNNTSGRVGTSWSPGKLEAGL